MKVRVLLDTVRRINVRDPIIVCLLNNVDLFQEPYQAQRLPTGMPRDDGHMKGDVTRVLSRDCNIGRLNNGRLNT